MPAADTSSRIIPVERRNIFVFLTVFFCLVNAIPHVFIWVDVGIFTIYMLFFVLVFLHAKRKAKIPRFLVGSADDAVVRLRDNGADVLTMIGCALLVVLKGLLRDNVKLEQLAALQQVAAILLITFAFWLSNRTRRGAPRRGPDRRSIIQKIFGSSKRMLAMPTAPPPPPPPPMSIDDVEDDDDSHEAVPDSGLDTVVYEGAEGDSVIIEGDDELSERQRNMIIWEERQRERWNEWIEQEVNRLNENRDD